METFHIVHVASVGVSPRAEELEIGNI